MYRTITTLKTRLYLISVLILVVGLCGAILIYVTAPDGAYSAESYVIVNGVAYPVDQTHSKAYVHELQRFGGKAAVVFDDLYRWFAGLWQGKSLAISVAWISVFASLMVYLYAGFVYPDSKPEIGVENDPDAGG